MLSQLCERREYVNHLTNIYEETSINIHIRSEFAEMGFSLTNSILKKVSLLNCALNFEIFSFGMAVNEEA